MNPTRARIILEGLETRRLFAVTNDDILHDIVGTGGDDEIEIRMHTDGERIVVVMNGEEQGPFKVGSGPEWYVSAFGSGGDDTIRVIETNGPLPVRVNFVGGSGDDTLIGGSEQTSLTGGKGNDTLDLGEGPAGAYNVALGGSGKDTISGSAGGDSVDNIFAGRGNDVVRQSGSEDVVVGMSVGEQINGETVAAFTIQGTAADDEIAITLDDDNEVATVTVNGEAVEEIDNVAAVRLRVLGNAGDDTITVEDTEANPLRLQAIRLRGGNGNDAITAGFRRVSVHGEDGNDTIAGSAGDDRLYGTTGNDELFGGDGADTMYGGEGDDELNGQAGDDWIKGNFGNDDLTGGTGDDLIFAREADDDTANGGAGQDTIRGLAGPDVID